jgi:NAD(P)-dependent dehydrogenase (short-subunit alcohol dehydrogenase family)
MSQRFTAQHALVTGAASGIGAALARRFAAEGAHVVVTDVDADGGERIAHEIGGTFRRLDVRDPDAWATVLAGLPPIDVAALNAGISTPERAPLEQRAAPLADLTDDAYRAILGINVDGVVFGARAVLPGMVERGRGHVVATASMAGLGPMPMDPIYGLTKHAVVGLVRSLGAALEGTGVQVVGLCPGFVDTNILSDEAKEHVRAMGLGILDPAEVAETAVQAMTSGHNGSLWAVWHGVGSWRHEPAHPFPQEITP